MELWPQIKEYCPNIKFNIVPFDNTPENAREILSNLGKKIDIVSGWFDDKFWGLSGCMAQTLENDHVCCALSINHPLAFCEKLKITDLYGETVMLIKRGWNKYSDAIRDKVRHLDD